jgi:signal transduction histidine kinase
MGRVAPDSYHFHSRRSRDAVKHPIRRQLLTPLLVVLVPAVAAVAGLSAWLSSSRQVALLQDRQTAVARVLADATFPLTEQSLRQMAELSGQQFVVWSTVRRKILISSLTTPTRDLEQSLASLAHLTGTMAPHATVLHLGQSLSVGAVRSRSRPEDEILILTPQRQVFDARREVIWPPLVMGAAVLLLLVPWLLRLTGNWSRRIQTLQQTVAGIARGETTLPLVVDQRDDELAALVADVETMQTRLGTLQSELVRGERERLVAQLAAGFAHQFRNGIAGASLALQLHETRCQAGGDGSLAVARRQLTLLEAEVRGILSLARLPESARQMVDLVDLARDAADLIAPALTHQAITFSTHWQGDLATPADSPPAFTTRVAGNPDALRAALINLLLNAVDAAGRGGEIRLEVTGRGTDVSVAVADNGPGPDPAIASRLSEPFVTTKPEGIGLGLTIVATVAHDHGGRFEWKRVAAWTVMELVLPALREQKRETDAPRSGGR